VARPAGEAIFGGLVATILTYFAINYNLGFAIPMPIGTVVGSLSTVAALLFSPETKGTVFKSDLVVA
jgi:SHS family lactate transporter-like MFS transporter